MRHPIKTCATAPSHEPGGGGLRRSDRGLGRRLERFLQLAAEQNIRIANCSTPAPYLHLLRRQALRHRIRALVVFTPKSLLRHPRAMSNLAELSKDRFHRVLEHAWAMERPGDIARLLLCSGKVYYDLLPEAEKLTTDRPAIVRIEQLYTLEELGGRSLAATRTSPRSSGCRRSPGTWGRGTT